MPRPSRLPTPRSSIDIDNKDYFTPPSSPMLASFAWSSVAPTPRKAVQRTTILAFFLLLSITLYLFFTASESLVHALSSPHPTQRTHLRAGFSSHRNTGAAAKVAASPVPGEQVVLTEAQELAALTAFIASLPQNSIPTSVDPSAPIDPQLILDFDTRSPRAMDEVNALVEDVWAQHPVVLYSKYYSSSSREVKSMLNELDLKPSPVIIDVDTREDSDVLLPIVHRLAGQDLPALLIRGKPAGDLKTLRKLRDSGALRAAIAEAGAVIGGGKKKKSRNH